MATSTIPAFMDALYTRFAADATLSQAQVCDGLPWPQGLEREAVIIMSARPGDPTGEEAGGQRAAALGRQRREERYIVQVFVSVLKPARETQRATRDRAFELVAAIENSIKAWGGENPAYAGTVRIAQVTATTLEQPAAKDDREALITVDIACQQRL
jgi:hypothetical protein